MPPAGHASRSSARSSASGLASRSVASADPEALADALAGAGNDRPDDVGEPGREGADIC